MQYRRSRTDMPRASPFKVRSSMEMTLLTVVYAGLQTAFGYRGRVRYLLVCPKQPVACLFQTIVNAKKITPAKPVITSVIRTRYYLERQTSVSPNGPPSPGVLA